MTALDIFTYSGTLVISSETIADGSGVQHKNVLDMIDANRSDFEDFGEVAFETRPGYHNAPVRVALLNEQQATLLMTFQRNTDQVRAFKKALVRSFFDMGRQVAPVAELSRIEILQLALESEQRAVQLATKVQQDAPKVLFADAVATSSSTILIGDLAKILRGNGIDIGANRLFERLRDEGFLIRRQGTDRNMPTQRAMDLELFKVKETAVTHSDGHVTVSKTPKVTGKGQAYFVNRYAPGAEMAVAS